MYENTRLILTNPTIEEFSLMSLKNENASIVEKN